ncbi:hypothetical protein, partial [uncultured Gemmiger sp.]|uniref:hypothetical protein n=1 Tax=uncultured Gemmiger sp. TaxID=1623490 RepID=UPI0025E2F1E7
PLAALTFAASSIICAFGLASAAPRLPYRHLELCGIALKEFILPWLVKQQQLPQHIRTGCAAGAAVCADICKKLAKSALFAYH